MRRVWSTHVLRFMLSFTYKRLLNTSWGAIWVVVMWWVLETLVEMHFVSSLAREGFRQCMLRCILWPWCHWGVWPIYVGLHFMCSLAWDGFGQHKLICVLCALRHWWGLVNPCLDTFLSLLAWDEFDLRVLRWIFLFGCTIWVCSTQVENHIFSTKGLDAYYVLAGMGYLINTCWDAFYVLAAMC